MSEEGRRRLQKTPGPRVEYRKCGTPGDCGFCKKKTNFLHTLSRLVDLPKLLAQVGSTSRLSFRLIPTTTRVGVVGVGWCRLQPEKR